MVHTLIYVLIINGLRTKVQSVDKITNQANRGAEYTKVYIVHCVLARCAWGRCLYMLVLFPQHDFYWEFVGAVR